VDVLWCAAFRVCCMGGLGNVDVWRTRVAGVSMCMCSYIRHVWLIGCANTA
jgi:hypothetical protein